MSESKNDKNEELATSQQAQTVVDELDRLLVNRKELEGIKGTKNHSAPRKIANTQGVLLFREVEGQNNIVDPKVINYGSASWDNPDGTHTSFHVELNLETGLQLTKRVTQPEAPDPASDVEEAHMRETADYASLAMNATHELAQQMKENSHWAEERSLGLHLATSADATGLIEKLQTMEPAQPSY
jgi:hypothetical protein